MDAQRMLYLTVAILIALGIWLTGLDKVHWILFLPIVTLTFAGITGKCSGLILFKKLGAK